MPIYGTNAARFTWFQEAWKLDSHKTRGHVVFGGRRGLGSAYDRQDYIQTIERYAWQCRMRSNVGQMTDTQSKFHMIYLGRGRFLLPGVVPSG